MVYFMDGCVLNDRDGAELMKNLGGRCLSCGGVKVWQTLQIDCMKFHMQETCLAVNNLVAVSIVCEDFKGRRALLLLLISRESGDISWRLWSSPSGCWGNESRENSDCWLLLSTMPGIM